MEKNRWFQMATNFEGESDQISAAHAARSVDLTDDMIRGMCKVAIQTNETAVRSAMIKALKDQHTRIKAADIFAEYATTGDTRERRWGLVNLSLLECTWKKDVVLKGLRDPKRSVQRAAAMNTGLYADPDFIRALESFFEHNEHAFLHESFVHLSDSVPKLAKKIKATLESYVFSGGGDRPLKGGSEHGQKKMMEK